jgi:hypothetical protein
LVGDLFGKDLKIAARVGQKEDKHRSLFPYEWPAL